MSRNRVEDFGPYQDGVVLFDAVVEDMELLRGDLRCYRLIGQQVGSADSICANIEEGFGRPYGVKESNAQYEARPQEDADTIHEQKREELLNYPRDPRHATRDTLKP